LTRESPRNPGILVSPIPDGNTHAALGIDTSTDGGGVVSRLLGEEGSS
jgi:hypothetical protein